MRRVGRAERERRVATALERVGLSHLADRSPGALSGGQQQRVATARTIVAEPRIVLFNEPLSNLDGELRESMVSELAGYRAAGAAGVLAYHGLSLGHQYPRECDPRSRRCGRAGAQPAGLDQHTGLATGHHDHDRHPRNRGAVRVGLSQGAPRHHLDQGGGVPAALLSRRREW